jgi:hypothetical protein
VEDPMDARSNLRDYIKYHFDIEDDEEINNYIACVEAIAEGVEWRKTNKLIIEEYESSN